MHTGLKIFTMLFCSMLVCSSFAYANTMQEGIEDKEHEVFTEDVLGHKFKYTEPAGFCRIDRNASEAERQAFRFAEKYINNHKVLAMMVRCDEAKSIREGIATIEQSPGIIVISNCAVDGTYKIVRSDKDEYLRKMISHRLDSEDIRRIPDLVSMMISGPKVDIFMGRDDNAVIRLINHYSEEGGSASVKVISNTLTDNGMPIAAIADLRIDNKTLTDDTLRAKWLEGIRGYLDASKEALDSIVALNESASSEKKQESSTAESGN